MVEECIAQSDRLKVEIGQDEDQLAGFPIFLINCDHRAAQAKIPSFGPWTLRLQKRSPHHKVRYNGCSNVGERVDETTLAQILQVQNGLSFSR